MDCIVIGGGPAGLAAAIYLARFRRSVRVLDSGHSRAMYIPCTNNLPGFPDGIAGSALLARLGRHVARFGVAVNRLTVTRLRRLDDGFAVEAGGETIYARTVLLSTGVVDRRPPVADLDELIGCGVVRLCPVCDAHELVGSSIGVFGPLDRSAGEASFLRTYTERVTVISTDPPRQAGSGLVPLAHGAAACYIQADIKTLRRAGSGVIATLTDGKELRFDALYLALGADPGSSLALRLGAVSTPSGCIRVDPHQRTNVPGLYAAGDVVDQLDQIAVAFGHAAVAATSIHNDLRHGPPN